MANVLFLEEEHATRKVFSEVLRNEGLGVVEAGDMPQAVNACDNYGPSFDLAIIDTALAPKGAELMAERCPQVRLLFVGEADLKSLIAHLRGRKAAWLPKPLTSDALLKAVRSLIADKAVHAGR